MIQPIHSACDDLTLKLRPVKLKTKPILRCPLRNAKVKTNMH